MSTSGILERVANLGEASEAPQTSDVDPRYEDAPLQQPGETSLPSVIRSPRADTNSVATAIWIAVLLVLVGFVIVLALRMPRLFGTNTPVQEESPSALTGRGAAETPPMVQEQSPSAAVGVGSGVEYRR